MSDEDLTSFIEDSIGESRLRVETDFGDGFVRLRSSEAQRRQAAQDIRCTEDIIIELLRNARDAGAHAIFLAVSRDESKRSIVCIDNGSGIPTSMHNHIFEPRVTSKLDTADMDRWGLHGRGMALYSISVNAQQASVVDSEKGIGTALKVVTDLTRLGEKADQSTFPVFKAEQGVQAMRGPKNTLRVACAFKAEQGVQAMRGPKNALRVACEFALEHRDVLKVYVGSPAEIASTLYAVGNAVMTPVQKAFGSSTGDLPLIKRLATAADPQDFRRIASGMGLDMSERTARRILDGTLNPLDDLLERMRRESFPDTKRKNRSLTADAGVKSPVFAESDLQIIKKSVADAYAEVARRYYLDGDVEPVISVVRGEMVVRIPMHPDSD